MGLLKDVVKRGVSSAISKGVEGVAGGISKGISDAVGAAVQKTVAPAADKLAGKAAEKINETAASVSQSINETTDALGTEAPTQASGFDSLSGSLSGLMGSLENAAAEFASGIKICPKCGEGAPAGTKFCPKCGAPLPEKTLGELYTCPKCGKKNLPETKFCVDCGTVLPAAEQEMAEKKAKDQQILASWSEYLAAYPVWNGSGCDYEIETNGEDNGYPVYLFSALNVEEKDLAAYIALLKENGFVRPEGYTSDESLYKIVDGVCRAFNRTEALAYERMSIGFYVGDFDKPKPEEKNAVDSITDGVAAAKKVLGKLFG